MVIKEFSTIMEAQSSRGLEVEKCGAAAKMKNYIIVSLPLLFRVIAKGHSISLAMHYYKLNFKVKRTSYKVIKATFADTVFIAVTLISTVITTILQIKYYIPL
jgi:energy-coupling factor transport system permease protein